MTEKTVTDTEARLALEPKEAVPAIAGPSFKDVAEALQEEFDRREAETAEKEKTEKTAAPRPKSKAVPVTPPVASGAAPSASSSATATNQAGSPNPFVPAESLEKRPKILLWGDSGSGKTSLALQFPKPVVIDMERGTELYGKTDKFHVVHTQDPDRVAWLVEWLRFNKHDYRTFVLDPITLYWEALQSKWSDIYLRRNKQSKGFKFEYYDFQPRDWMQIRDDFQSLLRSILALDMTVVVTAHSKAQYADGEFMKKIGETFDSQKKTPYLFDIVVQLTHDPKSDKHTAIVVKDRSRSLPKEPFETSYEPFARAFGKTLDRAAEPFASATAESIQELWRLAGEYGLTEAQVRARLESYGSADPHELSAENIAIITDKLKGAIAARAAQAKK